MKDILENLANLKALVEPLAKSIFLMASAKNEEGKRASRCEEVINHLYEDIKSIRSVKTLWQVDNAVDLKEFYCRQHIVCNSKRFLIRDLDDLEFNFVLIKGIAGQGKSILLRYLCAREYQKGKCLSLFIELRKISSVKSLTILLEESLKTFGLDDNAKGHLHDLAIKGKLALFLDGFDEIQEVLKIETLKEIEAFYQKYKNTKIVVTARPDSDLEKVYLCNVVKLDYYKGKEYKDVINNLSASSDDAEDLIKIIEDHKGGIEKLLLTPLLVTLLIITYKSSRDVPESLSDFYDSLFGVLLKRHDGTKPGYFRERKCKKINDKQYRELFEAFCFYSKLNKRNVFTYENIKSYAQSAIEKQNISVLPDNFLSDVVRITCLVAKDGAEYRFLHKSIQEYFAASFLRNRPDSVAKKFYDKLCNSSSSNYGQELVFLEDIDKFRYLKYYRVPLIKSFLDVGSDLPKTIRKVTKNRIMKYYKNFIINIHREKASDKSGMHFRLGLSMPVGNSRPHDDFLFSILAGTITKKHTVFNDMPEKEYSVNKLFETNESFKKALILEIETFAKKLHAECQNAEAWISKEESEIEEDISAIV